MQTKHNNRPLNITPYLDTIKRNNENHGLSDRCGMLSDLLAIFMSEAYAARFLREVRWSNGVRCIYCGSLSVIVGIGVRPV
jgi:hypothetical protein